MATAYRTATGRSVSSALVDAVREVDGSTLVIGSSADGPEGRIVTGSTADKLLHSAPDPAGDQPARLPLGRRRRVHAG